MILFWFLVGLSVYFEIFCYKICLETEKMVEKMWSICKKIAFSECYQTPKIVFRTIFQCKTKHQDFIFPYIHFTLGIQFTSNQTQPKQQVKED